MRVDPTWLREREEVGALLDAGLSERPTVEVSSPIRAELIRHASKRLLVALHAEPDRMKRELTSETVDAIDALSRCLESPAFSQDELRELVATIHPKSTVVMTDHGPAYHYDFTQKVDH